MYSIKRYLNHKLLGNLIYFNVNKSVGLLNHLTNKTKNTYSNLNPNIDFNKESDIKRIKYTNRSYSCGDLRSTNIGENVTLCGWLEFQRMNKFIVLRDGYGQIQLLVKEDDANIQKLLTTTPYESVLEVKGTVVSRPKEMVNKKQPTGEIEIAVDSLKVLNKSKENLPFNIREFQKAKEPLRMQYRYLDLRFPQMQRNMRFRSEFIMKMREFLINNHFVDVETPTLFKATPGGAQEFIVPTRFPGQFYSLVQSPQQFKQMLMGGGIDKYFQIARCYRDETSRPDRQPEFTQLDIEMSFTDVNNVIQLIEDFLQHCLNDAEYFPIKRMSYNEAIQSYGVDKPDVSFDFRLNNCTDILVKNEKLINSHNFGAYFLSFPKEYANDNKKVKEIVKNTSLKLNKSKLYHIIKKNNQDFINKFGKVLGSDTASALINSNNILDDSLLFLAFGDKNEVLSSLGKLRIEYVNLLEDIGLNVRKKGLHFLWLVDFPLFELSEAGCLQSAHHPFTAPHPHDLHLLETDPLKVRGLSYDLVLNGNEIAGGSIRIHDSILQKNILKMLNISGDSMQHMLDMLESGCPPHGGVAVGLDRLLSILLGTGSIRDVIAFPKNFEGRDPLSGAPSCISDCDKELYHIQTVDNKKN